MASYRVIKLSQGLSSPIEVIMIYYASGYQVYLCNNNTIGHHTFTSGLNDWLNTNTISIQGVTSGGSYGTGLKAKQSGYYAYFKEGVTTSYFNNPFFVEAGNDICKETGQLSAKLVVYYLGETNPYQ